MNVKDNSIEFKSIDELYNRVLPALSSKVRELNSLGYKFVKEKDIWNYLVVNTWKNKNNLELFELVNDILYLDNYLVSEYVLNKLNSRKEE